MNNLIKELTWHYQHDQYTTKSPTHSYRITSVDNKFKVIYCKLYDGYAREATGFNTLKEAKSWAFNHHCEKIYKWLNADALGTVPTFKEGVEELVRETIEAEKYLPDGMSVDKSVFEYHDVLGYQVSITIGKDILEEEEESYE